MQQEEQSATADHIRLGQSLGVWQVMSRGSGVVTAALAFVLLGEAAAAVGPLTPLAVLLAVLLTGVNILCYTALALNTTTDLTTTRLGSAYTLVHEKMGGSVISFLAGWALTLSGVGLCGLLAQGAARHLGSLLESLLGLSVPNALLAAGLMALVVLVSSLGWNSQRWPLTTPLVILVVLLIVAVLLGRAVPLWPSTTYTATYPRQPGLAVPLLLVAFIGLEIVTSHQEEIRRRAANLPRALLGTLTLTAALGIGLAAAAGPWMETSFATPLAPLGEAIAGPSGHLVILILGTAALLISLNRTLAMVTRHLYVMSHDGFLPNWLCQTNTRQRTPTYLITLLTGLVVVPTAWIPTTLLAPVGGLLYLLVLMAVSLTLARQRRENVSGRFALPFHPWVPALTLAVDLLATPLWGVVPAALAAGCMAIGALVYLVYARSRHIETQKGVTVFQPPADTQRAERFRVLVPVANPDTAASLLEIAGRLAQFQGGEAVALHVAVVPDPLPLTAGRQQAEVSCTVLERALDLSNQGQLPIRTMARVSRSVAQGILDAATEAKTDLILMGWQGPPSSRGASLGRIADAVLRDAPCSVLILQGETSPPFNKVLVPTVGGRHARSIAQLSSLLVKALHAEATFLYVQPPPTTAKQMEENRRKIAEALEGLSMSPPPEQKVVEALGVVEGIVQESQGYDLVLMGVSEEPLFDQIVFGSIPLQVAARVPAAALTRGARSLTGIWSHRLLSALRNSLPTLSREERLDVQYEIGRGAQPGINFFVLTILSCIIAALGLLLNSPAVVIGAMLVAPLMSPIMGFSLGLVTGDLRLIRHSLEAIAKGIALAVILAAFIGLISPIKTITGEMLARGQPTLLDLGVALVSGLAGAYALARKDVSSALPGVAIAAALMPPLATAGLALSMGDASTAGGAFLLFLTNTAAISLAAGVVFLLLGIRPRGWGPESRRQLRWRLIASLLLLLAIAIPLGIIMAGIVTDVTREQAVRQTITQHLAASDGQLVTLELDQQETGLVIVATIRSTQIMDEAAVNRLAERLSQRLGQPVQLEVVTLPTIRSLVTPTP